MSVVFSPFSQSSSIRCTRSDSLMGAELIEAFGAGLDGLWAKTGAAQRHSTVKQDKMCCIGTSGKRGLLAECAWVDSLREIPWRRPSREWNLEILPRMLHDQDHAGADDGDVAVVALEGGDGSFVIGGNGIESFAGADFVVNHGGGFGLGALFLVNLSFDLGRLGDGRLDHGGLRGL